MFDHKTNEIFVCFNSNIAIVLSVQKLEKLVFSVCIQIHSVNPKTNILFICMTERNNFILFCACDNENQNLLLN